MAPPSALPKYIDKIGIDPGRQSHATSARERSKWAWGPSYPPDTRLQFEACMFKTSTSNTKQQTQVWTKLEAKKQVEKILPEHDRGYSHWGRKHSANPWGNPPHRKTGKGTEADIQVVHKLVKNSTYNRNNKIKANLKRDPTFLLRN